MSNLKLVKKSKKLNSQCSNFWKCCPRKLEFLPEQDCPQGTPIKQKDNKVNESPQCEWWINSKDHHYCFWKFVMDNSNPDGSMKELVQADLAKLFGWSSVKTHNILKEALLELKEVFKNHELDLDLDNIDDTFNIVNSASGYSSIDDSDY